MCAALSIAAVIMIGLFVFVEGYPLMQKVGILQLYFCRFGALREGLYGILPMIAGTFSITLWALIMVPLIVFTAIFLAEYAPKN